MKSAILVLVLAFASSAFANEFQDAIPTEYSVPAFLRIDLGHDGIVEACGSNEAYHNEPCVKVTGRSAILRFLRSLKLGSKLAPMDPGQIGGN